MPKDLHRESKRNNRSWQLDGCIKEEVKGHEEVGYGSTLGEEEKEKGWEDREMVEIKKDSWEYERKEMERMMRGEEIGWWLQVKNGTTRTSCSGEERRQVAQGCVVWSWKRGIHFCEILHLVIVWFCLLKNENIYKLYWLCYIQWKHTYECEMLVCGI